MPLREQHRRQVVHDADMERPGRVVRTPSVRAGPKLKDETEPANDNPVTCIIAKNTHACRTRSSCVVPKLFGNAYLRTPSGPYLAGSARNHVASQFCRRP